MKMDLRVHAYFVKLICLFLFCFFGISTNLLAQPTITSFSPTSAKPGDVVTITGTNFNTTTTNNIVFFGATQATVTAATATSLTVTVPTGATFDYITELNTISGLACASNSKFTPVFSPNKSSIGTNDFSTKVDFTTGTLPFSVAIGDLDGDGKPDLAVANRFSNTVSIYRNTSSNGSISSSSFAAKVDFTTGSFPNSVAIGDIDGDGKPDLVVANSLSNAVSVFRNMSSSGSITSSSFSAKVDFTTGTLPFSVAIGDIDGDGKPDLAVANVNSNNVSAFRNTSSSGSISFAAKVDFYTGPGSTPYSVAIGDIDGDGKLDLAVANYANSTVSIFPNESSSGNIISNFGSRVDFTTGLSPVSVAIGDLDGDGKLDLAVANADDNTVSLLRNTSSGSISSGSFAAKVDFAIGSGSIPFSVSIGDINGDGKPDLAVANNGTNTVSVFRNMSSSGSIGSGSFAAKVDFATGSAPISVAIGDLDGDGKPDLVAANNSSNSVSVLRNTYIPPTITSFTPTSAKPGDAVTITGTNFNTTTTNNIVFFGATKATVTAATTTSLTVTVPTGATFDYITELNTGTGLACASTTKFTPTFSPNKSSITSADISAKVDFTTGAGSFPRSVAIGDIDGDGKPDLAVVNQGSNTVSIYRNTSSSGSISSGSFAAKVDFTTGTFPYSVAIGDIDGDGKPDLVVANRGSNTVSIYRNTSSSGSISSSSFSAKVDFTTGASPFSVAIGDIDGDGKPDLAVANLGSNTISVFRNTSSSGSISSSSFSANVDFATGINPYSVAIGDIDGDGKPDLVVTNLTSNTVSVFRNTSSSGSITSSSFAVNVDFATGLSPISLAIGDIDGDGKLDLAVANNDDNKVSVFRNTSSSGSITSSSFAAKVDFTTGLGPYSVTIGDLDGDGKPDLAVPYGGGNTVSIYRNTSSSGSIASSSFAASVDFTTGSSPFSVAIGDLDGDGKPDLALSNYGDNTVSVLRNNPVLPPTITSFTPTSAKPGDAVTITGTGFNTTTTNNIVFFGATKATVTAATTTSLTVTVPTGASFDYITELNTGTGLACASTTKFTPVFSPNKSSIGTNDFSTNVDLTSGNSSYSVAIGDVDGDGKADIAVANFGSNTVSVYRNTSSSGSISSGSFAAKVDFTTGTNPIHLVMSDLDGDGKLDLAIANYGANTVSILRNTSSSGSISSGSFSAKVDFTTGTNPYSVAIGDIDGDGKPDLAVANGGSNKVSIFRNTASSGSINSSSFAAKVDFTTGNNPFSVAIGDLDGDGKPDLAVVNNTSNTVSVFRNTASSGSITSSSFAAKVDFTTATFTRSVAIGDLDGDGKLDLVINSITNNVVSVLRNTSTSGSISSSSFAAKVDFSTGSGSSPYLVAIADLDGDGKADLTTANYALNIVSVFRNTSSSGSITSSSFAAKVDFTTGSGPVSVAIGDIDGDGKPDLTTANLSSSTLSVLRNTDVLTITTSGSLSAVNTTYGTASANTSFSVSGTGLSASLVVTAPTGYQVSTSASSGFGSSVSLTPSSGNVASTTIYVRIPGTTAVGTYTGNVVCSSTGATSQNVATVSSIVSAAALTITHRDANKTYGSTLTSVSGSTDFISSGLVNSETIGSVTVAYGTGAAATDAVGSYTGSVTPSAATGGTFTASNYTITYRTGKIIVAQAALTITASTANKTYGSTLTGAAGSTAFTSSGLVNSETIGSVSITYGTGAAASAAVGTYTGSVTPSAATGGTFTASNYNITYNTGNIIVGQANLTITATNANKTYGSALTGAAGSTAFTSSGLVNSETIGTVTVAYGTGAAATANVGTYTGSVTPSAATGGTFTASNYNITYATGNIVVGRREILITANNANKTYGSALTGGTGNTAFTTNGLVNGETIGSVTITYGTGSAATDAVGTYTGTVTASAPAGGTFTASNYSIFYAAGNIIVGQAALTITASTANKTYGSTLTGAAGSTAFTSSGLQNSETIGTVTVAYGTGAAATANVGTYTGSVTPSAATGGTFTASNYNITYATGNIVVGRREILITANNASKTYGSALTGGTGNTAFTTNGLVNGETIGSVTITYGAGSAATDAVGTYAGTVTASAPTGGTFTASNYSIFYAAGNIIVGTKALTITASAASKTYGTVASLTAYTTSGLVGTDAVSGLTLSSTGTAATAAVGTYNIIPSGATGTGLTNYAITYTNGILTVNQATLTITASAASKTYGTAATLSAYTTSGLVGTDAVSAITLSSTGTAATAAIGTYNIVPSGATGTGLTNYAITYTNGTLTVNQATLTITASAASKTYGTVASLTAYTTSGLVGSDAVSSVTLSSTGTAATAVIGTYNIVPSGATGTGLTNYAITYTNGTLTVNQAPLTITATNQSKCFGLNLSLPANGYSVSGLLNSDVVSSVTLSSAGATGTAAINTYPITISNATGTGLTNYNITYTNGVLNVIASATITTQPITTLTQCAGTSASISVSATGSPSFSYQWLLNGTAINGATNNTYTVPSLTAANAGSYTVIVTPTGGCAPVTSNASLWTVNALPVPSAITIPSPVCTGSGYTLTNSLSGGVWSSSNTGVATINASGGQVTPVSQGNTTISYAVTNSFGCLGTVTALLPVLSTPVKPVITRDFSGNLNSSYSGVNIWYNASSQQTVSGVSSSSYNPRANVRLQVQGNNSGCIGPWSDEFVYTTSSIATLYPNPASSYTVASIVSDRAQSITLQLTDMAGKVLQEIPVTLGTGQNPVRINTAALARGAYMLVIKGSGVTYQQFVKE